MNTDYIFILRSLFFSKYLLILQVKYGSHYEYSVTLAYVYSDHVNHIHNNLFTTTTAGC